MNEEQVKKLIKEEMMSNQQLTQFIGEYPNADIQHLRQLQRNAQKEAKEAKPPKSARLIYKYVKELISGEAEQS